MKNLKEFRKKYNLTQKQVAEKINVSQQTYNNYETKNYEPTIETLIKLAKLFNVSVDKLIGNETSNNINLTPYQQELLEKISKLTQIECLKVSVYIEGLKAGAKEYQQEKFLNKYKGE